MLNLRPENRENNVDLTDLQSQLNARIGSKNNSFHQNEWYFKKDSGVIKLNFELLRKLALKSKTWASSADEIIYSVKLLWLEVTAKSFSVGSYHNKYKGLCLLASYLITTDQKSIDQDNLYGLLEFTLMNSWQKNSFHKRLSPKTYDSYRAEDTADFWQITRYNNVLAFGFSRPANKNNIKKMITSVLEDLSGNDLTYRDWVEGGSFDFLTLDQGKYYIEHCINFCNTNINIAIATKTIFNDSTEILTKIGWSVSKRNLSYISSALIGELPEKLIKNRKISLAKITILIEEVRQRYTSIYLKLYKDKQLSCMESISSLANKLFTKKVPKVTLDKLKFMVENRETAFLKKWLYELNLSINASEFNLLVESIADNIKCPIIVFPNKNYLNSIGLNKIRHNNNLLKPYITMVKTAGITSIVALLGWRESEFGFPLSSIKVFENKDFLDSSHMLLRYNVLWHVKKTNGQTKLNREISYSAYQLIKQLALLNNADINAPCIYSVSGIKKDIHQSNSAISTAIHSMWGHFVEHYPPFKKLDEIKEIKKIKEKLTLGDVLSNDEATILRTENYVESNESLMRVNQDKNLLSAWKRVKTEFDRVSFFLTPSGNALKIGWLYKYKLRTLPKESLIMLDNFLSEETKKAINLISSESEITGTFTQQVTTELVSGCIYPTPHALRHMWAEAVYRRFDGDAGWMIRSQFQHISSSMWLSYIKNKDNRRLHDKVKIKVISSLLKNYLMKHTEGYSGKLHVFLRRLYKNTSISSMEDFDNKIDEFAKFEFKDIKSTPWGYCILKYRQIQTAKCTQNGMPQRQNASPKLCLGCNYNLTQSTNLEHIVLNLSNDINIVKNGNLPEAYLNSSYETLRNTRRHIRELDPSSQYLPVIEGAIEKHMTRLNR
jgi:hypothetical protein